MADRPHVELVHPPDRAGRAPYAYAAIARNCSRLVFTAGACPLDLDGETVAPGDVAGQAQQAMVNLRAALEAAGARLEDVVKTTIYVASPDHADLLTAWNVIRESFGDHAVPSTLLGVALLGYRYQLVEVEAIAALP